MPVTNVSKHDSATLMSWPLQHGPLSSPGIHAQLLPQQAEVIPIVAPKQPLMRLLCAEVWEPGPTPPAGGQRHPHWEPGPNCHPPSKLKSLPLWSLVCSPPCNSCALPFMLQEPSATSPSALCQEPAGPDDCCIGILV